ncbi:hypothetical protein NZ043_27320 [Paenibacillus sp. FSL k6-2145]|uniref:DUF7662 domain-containing protein n=1 Tax=Paenibacillus sp. FSL k6-2145 TaxID=2976834 RepID=UPI0030DB31AE
MNKYDPLNEYLCSKVTLTLTYADIEYIIGSKLPESAFKDRTWWGNTTNATRVQAHSWLKAGWKVEKVNLGENITFIRSS